MAASEECGGCGNESPENIRVCDECQSEFCDVCDMGEDVQCERCVDMEEEMLEDQDDGG